MTVEKNLPFEGVPVLHLWVGSNSKMSPNICIAESALYSSAFFYYKTQVFLWKLLEIGINAHFLRMWERLGRW